MRFLRLIGVLFALAVGSTLLSVYAGQVQHLARHGGLILANGPFDLELVPLARNGRYALYVSDTSGKELPASVVSDITLVIQRIGEPAEDLALRIDKTGQSWQADGRVREAPISAVRVSYRVQGREEQAEAPIPDAFHAELTTSTPVEANTPIRLTFAIKDFFGRNTSALEIVHEKPIHLMIVSADLAEFCHIHPMLSAGDVFSVTHVFPHGGDYRAFADFTPVGGQNRIESFSLKVQGPGRAAIPIDPNAPWTGSSGSVQMTLASEKPLRTGEDIGLYVTLRDTQTGAPIHDLQRYLGAWAHIAIISQDTQDFLHVHPMEEFPSNFEFFVYMVKRDLFHVPAREPGEASPATLRTFVGFRRPGIYKMWVEVQRANQVAAIPFVLRVAPGTGQVAQIPRVPAGATLIKVSSAGYQPSRISAKAGQPLKLAFFRVDAENCGRVVRFPELGIERQLPPGETVVIELTPRKSGPLAFSCGMNMMKGELLVQ